MHLPCIAGTEPAGFQFNDDQAFQAAMEEQQVDAEPGVVQAQPTLAASGLTKSSGLARSPCASIFALFTESAVRS